jgi:branched-chain amino acid transport system ATP-binding protein
VSVAAAAPLLRVERVGRTFGRLVAVNDVSLDVPAGEFCAVIGPNGAGKTTFFNLVSGLVPPSTGRIVFDGRDITALPPHARVALGIARTFQITEVFPELSLRENVRVAVETAQGLRRRARLSKDEAAAIDRRIDALLEMGRIAGRGERLAGEVSHGDQRAVEILMSLALRPRLLLLDEPTAGMGDQETYDITQLIRRVHHEEGLTTVLIEHDMRVVFHLADRIVVLAEGAVLAAGTSEQIAADEAVQQAYLGGAE